jgi:allantoinase
MSEQGWLSRRVPFSADRPALQLPDGARMLVWVIVNVEHSSMERSMPRTVLRPPMGQLLQPDLPNWTWQAYGMRVGFWRVLDALKNLGIIPQLAINGSVCETCPRVAQAALDLDWEFMGHGDVRGPMHALANQPEAIAPTVNAIKTYTGKTPPIMLLQSHSSAEMYERGVAQVDRLGAESATIPRVMAISLHPYITGAPHRIAMFERSLSYVQSQQGAVIRTGAQINDWYRAQVPAPAPFQ